MHEPRGRAPIPVEGYEEAYELSDCGRPTHTQPPLQLGLVNHQPERGGRTLAVGDQADRVDDADRSDRSRGIHGAQGRRLAEADDGTFGRPRYAIGLATARRRLQDRVLLGASPGASSYPRGQVHWPPGTALFTLAVARNGAFALEWFNAGRPGPPILTQLPQ